MSCLMEGFLDDHALSVIIATARDAFAKAIDGTTAVDSATSLSATVPLPIPSFH